MYILNPDPYSLPCYRIGPFKTSDVVKNHQLEDSDLIDDYFNERFSGKEFIYTENGRKAINLALSDIGLHKNDVVSIFTTSDNFYISGCVTAEIEKFCKWSRVIQPETKAIFINHEFGFPYKNLRNLKKYNLPIIEDCANAFFSIDKNGDTGNIGDYVVYSFPKTFPLQVGGMLVANKLDRAKTQYCIDYNIERHVKNVLSNYINTKVDIISKRLNNYSSLQKKFEGIGFDARFAVEEGIMPGVFMFSTVNSGIDLPKLKKHFWEHGIQSSVFYGEEAFFIPVHQALNEDDLNYFFEVFQFFLRIHNL
ncbi:MAG: DegT/DnrJ/EryC1/StrS family aminotransferase [Marinilabiliaceae bacterium]|nr:DegT/DnrJ/EryC1/StrS family aminotransferase [Marinilabiliaceae bacterium]